MERCLVRFGLAIGCACLAIAGAGCESIRPSIFRRGQEARDDRPAFYDEFFEEDDAASDGSPKGLFKNNRLPGGLSSEAREIERGSFNIY